MELRAPLGSIRTLLGILLATLASGACSSYSHLRFAPLVQETELRGADNDVQARLAATWGGIEERGDALEVRFRMRIDNPGTTLFTLVPARFELMDAALNIIATTEAEGLPVAVEPGGGASFDVRFPLPDDSALDGADLSSLTLRTRLQGERWSWSTNFARAEYAPYDPYWDPWRFHFGATWCY